MKILSKFSLKLAIIGGMAEKKTIFIIPGFRHSSKSAAYKNLAKTLKKEGYFPIIMTIPWKNRTISENTAFFLKEYKKIRRKKKYILGFSFGAMIAFLAATKVTVAGLLLCSLSPYFREDILKGKVAVSSHLYDDFKSLYCSRLAKKIKAKKILMLYGTREEKPLIHRVTSAFAQISSKQKYLVPVQATEHNIGDKKYLQAIYYMASQLQ